LILLTRGFINYADEFGLGVMIHIQTHRQKVYLISLLYFFKIRKVVKNTKYISRRNSLLDKRFSFTWRYRGTAVGRYSAYSTPSYDHLTLQIRTFSVKVKGTVVPVLK
jgi:hypothetical protein